MSPEITTAEITSSDAALRRFLHGLPGVDEAACDRHTDAFVPSAATLPPSHPEVELAIAMVDLTTLEGTDTPLRVGELAARALHPDPADPSCPSTAAVCVYPDMVSHVRDVLADTPVRVASVAGGFPSGRTVRPVKVAEVAQAVAAGADEVDVVLDRGAFLDGRYLQAYEDLAAMREACVRPDGHRAHLKVILETGELTSYDNVRRAAWLAMLAGADFVKTSTGKVQPAATLPVTSLLMDAVKNYRATHGRQVGVKPAGGIRTSDQAVAHLRMANALLGADWLSPEWFRFGASSLLDDLLRARNSLK